MLFYFCRINVIIVAILLLSYQTDINTFAILIPFIYWHQYMRLI